MSKGMFDYNKCMTNIDQCGSPDELRLQPAAEEGHCKAIFLMHSIKPTVKITVELKKS